MKDFLSSSTQSFGVRVEWKKAKQAAARESRLTKGATRSYGWQIYNLALNYFSSSSLAFHYDSSPVVSLHSPPPFVNEIFFSCCSRRLRTLCNLRHSQWKSRGARTTIINILPRWELKIDNKSSRQVSHFPSCSCREWLQWNLMTRGWITTDAKSFSREKISCRDDRDQSKRSRLWPTKLVLAG